MRTELHPASFSAATIAPSARDWLAGSGEGNVLHVFDHVCNLVNERREVLSVVAPQIGNGPFNLVMEEEGPLLSDHLNTGSSIQILPDRLMIGDVTIRTSTARLWAPRPPWEKLRVDLEPFIGELASECPPSQLPRLPESLMMDLTNALSLEDIPSSLQATRRLAGLGAGLTPAGDDFILGAILAAWLIHPREVAEALAREVTREAALRTTSLSAAWLRSAGKGEAGILWHQFFDTWVSSDPVLLRESIKSLCAIGDTSGADAFAGFMGVLSTWQKRRSNPWDRSMGPASPSEGPRANAENAAGFDTGLDDVFGRIASRYDLLCDLFSFGIHRIWKRRVAAVISSEPWLQMLDCATGTGDIILRVLDQGANGGGGHIIASDISPQMLALAHQRLKNKAGSIDLRVLDAHSMPSLRDASVDLYSISVGLKICARGQVLREALRVLRPGGRLVILETSHITRPWLHQLYLGYMRFCIPVIGWIATGGDSSAYKYLLKGIEDFPSAEVLSEELTAIGFEDVCFERLSLGIVAIHVARKPREV